MSLYNPNRGNYRIQGVSRARPPDGTYSRDGRMVVRGGIWVWADSGKPVSPNRTYRRRY